MVLFAGLLIIAPALADDIGYCIPSNLWFAGVLGLFAIIFTILCIKTDKKYVFFEWVYLVIAELLMLSSITLVMQTLDNTITQALAVVFVGLVGLTIFWIFIQLFLYIMELYKEKKG